MGFFDSLFGRDEQESRPQRPRNATPQRSEDEIAIERYQYLLRTAPPETIEQVHTEAFSKLTPEQRDILFQKLTENASPSERPANSEPATLAKAATRAEFQNPGTLTRTLGSQGGPSFGSMIGASLLGSVAGYVIGSALVSTFMPMDQGVDAGSADAGTTDASTDSASADSGSSDASAADSGAGDGFGGGDFGSGGDFGGFDGGGFDF